MKRKNNWLILFFRCFFLLIITGCSFINDSSEDSQTTMDSRDADFDTMEASPEEAQDMAKGELAEELDLGEKIIETATLNFETTNFDQAVEFVNEQIEKMNAQLEHSSRGEANSSYGFVGEYINMTIRVPQEQLHPFIDQLNENNNLYVQNQDVGIDDATKIYRDNETRIDILKDEEKALREMLEDQGSLEEVLEIRTRLSEILAEREILESDNKNIDEQVDYSTIYLNIQQTDRANTQEVHGFWNRLTNAFVDSFYRFIAVSQQIIIGLVYLIPYLLILGVISFSLYLLIRKIRKR